MTDEELIARLRDKNCCESPSCNCDAAADRIEALVREKRWIMEERDRTFALMLDRAEQLEAALTLTIRADDLRDVYHAMPNDNHRIGQKRSPKAHAREAWLRAFRKAAMSCRTAMKGNNHV